MTRPRIRTLKPECWHDEKISSLSREARLLFVVLLTMADDEGRLRSAPPIIVGHGYPYDKDVSRRLPKWLAELEQTGAIVNYAYDGQDYIAFRHWRRHQKVNRPVQSQLPPPPERAIVIANAIPTPDGLTETSVSANGGGVA